MSLKNRELFISVLFLLLFTSIAFSKEKCTSEMDVYKKTQTITSSLIFEVTNPNIREMTDYYGEQAQIAEALAKEGKYQEACDIYQGVIDKYGFKTVEERYYEKHPEKRPENQKKAETQSPSSAVSSDAAEAATEASGAATE